MDSVQVVLQKLVTEYGRSLVSDGKKLRALLKDEIPGQSAHITALCLLVEVGTVESWMNNRTTQLDLAQFNQITNHLIAEGGLQTQLAEWSVESWALALGMQLPTNAAQPSRITPSATVSDQIQPSREPEGQTSQAFLQGQVPTSSHSSAGLVVAVIFLVAIIGGLLVYFLILKSPEQSGSIASSELQPTSNLAGRTAGSTTGEYPQPTEAREPVMPASQTARDYNIPRGTGDLGRYKSKGTEWQLRSSLNDTTLSGFEKTSSPLHPSVAIYQDYTRVIQFDRQDYYSSTALYFVGNQLAAIVIKVPQDELSFASIWDYYFKRRSSNGVSLKVNEPEAKVWIDSEKDVLVITPYVTTEGTGMTLICYSLASALPIASTEYVQLGEILSRSF